MSAQGIHSWAHKYPQSIQHSLGTMKDPGDARGRLLLGHCDSRATFINEHVSSKLHILSDYVKTLIS